MSINMYQYWICIDIRLDVLIGFVEVGGKDAGHGSGVELLLLLRGRLEVVGGEVHGADVRVGGDDAGLGRVRGRAAAVVGEHGVEPLGEQVEIVAREPIELAVHSLATLIRTIMNNARQLIYHTICCSARIID